MIILLIFTCQLLLCISYALFERYRYWRKRCELTEQVAERALTGMVIRDAVIRGRATGLYVVGRN